MFLEKILPVPKVWVLPFFSHKAFFTVTIRANRRQKPKPEAESEFAVVLECVMGAFE